MAGRTRPPGRGAHTMKKKPAVRHRLSTVQRIFFSYVFICLVPVVILAGVLAVTALTVTVRSWRAVNENPAESVKSE